MISTLDNIIYWFGILVIYLSLPFLAYSPISGIVRSTAKNKSDSRIFDRWIGIFIIGATITCFPLYFSNPLILGNTLYIGGEWLSGLTAALFYGAFVEIIKRKSQVNRSNVVIHIVFSFVFFFFIISGWLFGYLLFMLGTQTLIGSLFILGWAVFTAIISGLGLGLRINRIKEKMKIVSGEDEYKLHKPVLFTIGAVLGITGAQIVNSTYTISSIPMSIGGNMVYSLGYWLGFLTWIYNTYS